MDTILQFILRLLGEVLACIACAAVAYIVGTAHGKAAAKGSEALKREVAAAAAASAVEASASGIEGLRSELQAANRRIGNATRALAVYRDCRHDPGVLRDLADITQRRRPAGADGPGLRLAEPAGR